MYLVGLAGGNINIKGLLLAGIIIGALGVLDDVIISQVALVKELKISNPELTKSQIYNQAMRVGISHLSSMVNTLFWLTPALLCRCLSCLALNRHLF